MDVPMVYRDASALTELAVRTGGHHVALTRRRSAVRLALVISGFGPRVGIALGISAAHEDAPVKMVTE
jgi:hypothetical protein